MNTAVRIRPGTRPERVVYALVAVVLALSTQAPFVRFDESGPSFSAGDGAAALLSLVACTAVQ